MDSYYMLPDTYVFSTVGSLPPGCSLKHYNNTDDTAYIVGTPKVAGTYSFNVYVQARGYDYDSNYRRVDRTDWGSVSCSITILPAENTSNDTPAPGPISEDTPVPNPKPEALDTIAQALGTTSDNMSYISSSDMAAPQAPTSRITNALSALSFDIISTQGSLNVNKSGYYAFPMTVPASLVGTNTELRVYLADRSEFGESSFRHSATTSPLTTAQIFTESGGTVTILPGTIIAAANLAADTARTFSTHIVKAQTDTSNKNDDKKDDDNADDKDDDKKDDGNKGVSGSGGGCNSLAGLTAILLAAITLRKSHS